MPSKMDGGNVRAGEKSEGENVWRSKV